MTKQWHNYYYWQSSKTTPRRTNTNSFHLFLSWRKSAWIQLMKWEKNPPLIVVLYSIFVTIGIANAYWICVFQFHVLWPHVASGESCELVWHSFWELICRRRRRCLFARSGSIGATLKPWSNVVVILIALLHWSPLACSADRASVLLGMDPSYPVTAHHLSRLISSHLFIVTISSGSSALPASRCSTGNPLWTCK